METMQQVVLVGHTLISVLIIILVLLQRGKHAYRLDGDNIRHGLNKNLGGLEGSASWRARTPCTTSSSCSSKPSSPPANSRCRIVGQFEYLVGIVVQNAGGRDFQSRRSPLLHSRGSWR